MDFLTGRGSEKVFKTVKRYWRDPERNFGDIPEMMVKFKESIYMELDEG